MTALVELDEVFCVHRTSEGDAAALQGATLSVGEGELVCLLGPSGAGKSTVLRVIAGLQVPSAGEVRVLGYEMGRLGTRARGRLRHDQIGFLPQRSESALPPDLRVHEAIALPLALRGVERRQRRARAGELLEAAGLRERADALPVELSGGERQRIALCVALAHAPRLLLADEPTGELDTRSADTVRELISELTRARGAGAIVVSHDPAAARIADRTLRIRDGRVVEEGGGDASALVVGRGGWVRLASELRARASIGDRVRVEAVRGGLMLRPVPRSGLTSDATIAGGSGDRGSRAEASTPWSPAVVRIRALTHGRGRGNSRRELFDDFTHELAAGRLTVVTGRSGTGKSTLLALIAGLERPDGGELLIDGRPLGDLDPESLATLRRERTGYMAQEPTPIGFLSAEENVMLSLHMRGWRPAEASERASVVLTRVGLADRARQRLSRLSAGEVQRVALARALAAARGLLIVDEPSSRLDETNAAAVAELLAGAAEEDGQTVLCATHDEQLILRADEFLALG